MREKKLGRARLCALYMRAVDREVGVVTGLDQKQLLNGKLDKAIYIYSPPGFILRTPHRPPACRRAISERPRVRFTQGWDVPAAVREEWPGSTVVPELGVKLVRHFA